MRKYLFSLLLVLASACGCERCSRAVPEKLKVGGPTPYVRCLAGPPPASRKWRVGAAQFEIAGRVLTVEGWKYPIKIAAFSGPAFSDASPASALKKVAAVQPRLVIVLGGVGDNRERATSTLHGIGELGITALIVAGGRDEWGDLRAAFSALDNKFGDLVVDATALRSIRIGRDLLIPIAGASNGRYSRDNSACGFAESDLASIASEVGAARGERRWLLSWQAPAGGGTLSVARTTGGVDTGDEALAAFAERIGARGGLFAWPDLQVMRPRTLAGNLPLPWGIVADDLRLVVPRLAGPAIERDDGTRAAPGFALVILNEAGMLAEQY